MLSLVRSSRALAAAAQTAADSAATAAPRCRSLRVCLRLASAPRLVIVLRPAPCFSGEVFTCEDGAAHSSDVRLANAGAPAARQRRRQRRPVAVHSRDRHRVATERQRPRAATRLAGGRARCGGGGLPGAAARAASFSCADSPSASFRRQRQGWHANQGRHANPLEMVVCSRQPRHGPAPRRVRQPTLRRRRVLAPAGGGGRVWVVQ